MHFAYTYWIQIDSKSAIILNPNIQLYPENFEYIRFFFFISLISEGLKDDMKIEANLKLKFSMLALI